MARTTLQNALSELHGLLASDTSTYTPQSSLSTLGVVRVYPHEPGASGVSKPCSVTISPSGMEPTEWRITIRVYVDDQDPARAQDLLIDVPVAIDQLLPSGYGPSRWEMGWDPDIKCWAAVEELMVGREDYF